MIFNDRRSGFIRDIFCRSKHDCRSGFSRDGFGNLFNSNKSRINPLLQLCILFCAVPAHADYQAGLDAYNSGDYFTAMAEWKAVAVSPDNAENLAIYRESLYAIGMLYWQGEGVEQDYGVSAVWLKQAADINHPGAQVKLGYLYSTGQGVPLNLGEAEKYFRMAAKQGDADALHNLEILEAESDPESEPSVVAGLDAGEDWILARDPGHYTIQVISLRQPQKLHAFIAAHAEWAPFAIYGQDRDDKPLWVMVQGVYADVESARTAARSFPRGFQQRDRLVDSQVRDGPEAD